MTTRVVWLRALTLLAAAVVAQVTILDVIGGRAVRVDAPLLLLVAIGFRVRPDELSVLAFAAGVGTDLFHTGPFGQHAVAYVAIGILVAVITAFGGQPISPLTRAVVAAGAVVGGWIVLGLTASLTLTPFPLASVLGAAGGIHLASALVARSGVVARAPSPVIGRSVDRAPQRRGWFPVQ